MMENVLCGDPAGEVVVHSPENTGQDYPERTGAMSHVPLPATESSTPPAKTPATSQGRSPRGIFAPGFTAPANTLRTVISRASSSPLPG